MIEQVIWIVGKIRGSFFHVPCIGLGLVAITLTVTGAIFASHAEELAQESAPEPTPEPSLGEAALLPVKSVRRAESAERHVLGGHNFVPSLLIPPPFIDTQTNLVFAGGYGNYPSNVLGLGNDLKLAAFEPVLSVQYAPSAKIAFSIGVNGNVISGVNTNSVLVYGASVERQWNIGAIGNLLEADKAVLALALNVGFPHYLSVSPISGIAALNRVISVATPDFVNSNVSTVWKPNLRFAYAFNPTFGFIALAGGKVLQLSEGTTNQSTANLNFALGASADLKPDLGWPIGVTANFNRNQVLQNDDSNSNILSFGLYETAWTQVAFGLEVGFGDAVGQNSTIAGLNARVYY